MEFYLKYQGVLKSNASPQDKHALRKHFHRQIKCLFDMDENLHKRENWSLEAPASEDEKTMYCIVQKEAFHFAPLISSKLFLLAEIDITLLWSDLPGQIIGNGDIDNKLKTLLDALSCPVHSNQLTGLVPAEGEKPFYCLLEDDKLIQNINVRTHTLFDCNDKKEQFVLLHVKSKCTKLVWGNMGL
ncbi:MAG TPA: hypothetical protein VGJ00_08335 [Rhabdochlamydiaceae bacterium]|jgi:hypothetical protein